MFVLMSVHHPKPEHEAAVIDSMHRYGNALRGQPGLVSIHTLKDQTSKRLVGLAVFEAEEAFQRLAPIARAAVQGDPFDVWESVPIDGFRLVEA